MRRGLAVMTIWYTVPILAVLAFLLLAPTHTDTSGMIQSCTSKNLDCFQVSQVDVVRMAGLAGMAWLVVTVPVSLGALALMTAKRMAPAGVTGTLATFTGWLFGAVLVSCVFGFHLW